MWHAGKRGERRGGGFLSYLTASDTLRKRRHSAFSCLGEEMVLVARSSQSFNGGGVFHYLSPLIHPLLKHGKCNIYTPLAISYNKNRVRRITRFVSHSFIHSPSTTKSPSIPSSATHHDYNMLSYRQGEENMM